jgi:hypothetical protein
MILMITFCASGLVRLEATAGGDQTGTGTCHDRDERILECREKVTYEDGRKSCYAHTKAYRYTWKSDGPTCFQIMNGDVRWP